MGGRERSGEDLGARMDKKPKAKMPSIATSTRMTRAKTQFIRRANVMSAVFNTTELVENIVRFLPVKSLVVAQMVCVKWRDVIEQVAYFKQLMFLEPTAPKAAWTWTLGEDSVHTIDKLDVVPALTDAADFEDHITVQADMHPLLTSKWVRNEGDALQLAAGTIFRLQKAAKWRHKLGSWRQMLVTQPPALTVEGQFDIGDEDGHRCPYHSGWHTFESATGVTLGDLVDYGIKLEADGMEVNWARGWFVACNRACWTDEDVKEAEARSRWNEVIAAND
ncbi:hypothetical protein LTR01_007275 [Friedmanniomyces endolithicus]|nr:hypothetical protein LTR01_007275 [Friedmanniomyces endolithicus]KAK0824831.1 hypothetical protein LTR73_007384 [Friedmanniomyces endolithicus]